jgi:hypothetical protein
VVRGVRERKEFETYESEGGVLRGVRVRGDWWEV